MTTFHSTPPPWFESVKDLAPGGKRRVGDGLLASFNGRAYMLYDFRDKEAEVYEPQMTLEQKLAVLKAEREAQASAITSNTPPPGMRNPRDWPSEARVWLHKAGINNQDIQDMGAVYSPTMDRVVIPLHLLNGATTWIARKVHPRDKTDPKYLLPNEQPKGIGAIARLSSPTWAEHVVLTEDYLSAWRVSRADRRYVGIALLGTSLGRDSAVELVSIVQRSGAQVHTWLDPDEYGQKGARRVAKDLRTLGIQVDNIVSGFDPKVYSPQSIRNYVEDLEWRT